MSEKKLNQLQEIVTRLDKILEVKPAKYPVINFIRAWRNEVQAEIDELEADAADPWRDAKYWVELFIQRDPHNCNYEGLVARYARHLEQQVEKLGEDLLDEVAANGRKDALIEELEEQISFLQPQDAYLGDFRVLKTACEIGQYTISNRHAHEWEKHLAVTMRESISAFVVFARKWNGLNEIKPYKWSSIGNGVDHLIEQKEQK